MNQFLHRSGWHPTVSMPVAGAVPYTRYGWLKKLIMRRIMMKRGGGVDIARDYDYTDWNALHQFVVAFAHAPEQETIESTSCAHPPHGSIPSLPAEGSCD